MADYKKAIEKALKNEGGYVFDPDDAGGETFAGIARRYHKIWIFSTEDSNAFVRA